LAFFEAKVAFQKCGALQWYQKGQYLTDINCGTIFLYKIVMHKCYANFLEGIMVTETVRLTANVPKYIAEQAEEIAAARKLSRSKLVSECLLAMIEERKRNLLVEGYKAMSSEHAEFAKLSQSAAKEALPEWREK
jgi:hypothetical protein